MNLKEEIWVAFSVLCGVVLFAKLMPFLNERFFKQTDSRAKNPLPEGFRWFQGYSVAVFLLAMGANWFYGSHLMELYTEYGFNQFEQSVLMSIGFVTAALSGLVIGNFADSLGRKKACLLYAFCYGITVLCHHFNNVFIIGVGRCFAGIATALLYCAFESWMIAAHNEKGYPGHLLGSTFNLAWGLNFPIAALVGVLCDETSKVPWGLVGDFDASAVVLVIMAIVICLLWEENYGEQSASVASKFRGGFYACGNWNVIILSIIQTFFEGSMFVFVRFWYDVLHEANGNEKISCGIIFSTFMMSAMTGTEILRFMKLFLSKKWISFGNCAVAGLSLLAIAMDWNVNLIGSFKTKLFLFCIYEMCVGVYFNVMTDIRGELIDDSVRATVTALCRVPLNCIVVTLLLTDADKTIQFYCLAAFNAIAMIAAFCIRKEKTEEEFEEEHKKVCV